MYALSVRQPWAWALFHGKPVENRVWSTKFRGELLIHASKGYDNDGYDWLYHHRGLLDCSVTHVHTLRFGVIIGKVTMIDCVTSHPSPFFFGPYGHIYKDQVEFKNPIPFKGKLKFFDVPAELIKE